MNRIAESLEIVKRAKALGNYDCNVIGMAAEIIAEEQFGMSKVSTGTKTIDGYWSVNGSIETVQVKGWSCSRVARYKGGTFLRIPVVNPPDNLLIILFYSRLGEFEILYSGRANTVGKSEKNGKTKVVSLNSIKTPSEVSRILEKIGKFDI